TNRQAQSVRHTRALPSQLGERGDCSHFYPRASARSITVIDRFGSDVGFKPVRGNGVAAQVVPSDVLLKLRRATADVLQSLHIRLGQKLDDRACAAYRLEDNSLMLRDKLLDDIRLICYQCLRHVEAILPEQLRLKRF